MGTENNKRIFVYLPVISLFGYWFFGCVICAVLTRDPRMLKIGFVSAPLVLGMAACVFKLSRSGGGK